MTETDNDNDQDNSPTPLQQVTFLLRKYKLVEGLVNLQDAPDESLVHSAVQKQNLSELQHFLDQLHPADIALILEALPMEDRLLIWSMVKADRDGEVLLETSDAVRETLITDMGNHELVAATEYLDADEIADLAPDLPQEVMDDVFRSLPVEEREQLRAAMSYPEDSVGALMDFDVITIREDVRMEVVLRYLRMLDEMPDHTDQLFVVDRNEQLKGVLLINRLLVSDPDTLVADVMTNEIIKFVAGSEKFVPHFHIPLQSGSNKILKLMRRRYLRELYSDRVNYITSLMPYCCIGVDVITGFPGETAEDFLDTYQFLNQLDISYLHVFTYSERTDTLAVEMRDVVPQKIREERTQQLRNLSEKKRRYFYEQFVGTIRPVLFEEETDGEYMYGFTDNYIKVKTHYDPLLVNEIVMVKLLGINAEGVMDAEEIVQTTTILA